MRRATLILTLSIFLYILSACVPNFQETAQKSEITPTFTPLFTLKLTATKIPTPTASVTPAFAKIRSNTPTSTVTPPPYFTPTIPSSTLAALHTLDAIVTNDFKVGEYYSWDNILYPGLTTGLGLSPNGLWGAFFAARGNDGGLVIKSIDGEKSWEIYNGDVTGETGGVNFLSLEHWSLDGKYIYLLTQCECSGGYDWFWKSESDLIRLDLETGKWIDTKMGEAFSFSPNDMFLAYSSEQGIHVHEFQTGKEQIFTPPYEHSHYGQIVWSLDSKKLIFVASSEELGIDEQNEGFTAYIVDLDKNTLQVVFKNDSRYIFPVSWNEPSIIALEALFIDENREYILNVETNEITQVTDSYP